MICSFDKVKNRALLQNVRFQEHSENKALVLLFANYQTKESTVLLGPSGDVYKRQAAAEVLSAHHQVALLDAGDERLIDVFHAMAGQLGGALGVQVAGRDDNVSVDIVAVFKNRDVYKRQT